MQAGVFRQAEYKPQLLPGERGPGDDEGVADACPTPGVILPIAVEGFALSDFLMVERMATMWGKTKTLLDFPPPQGEGDEQHTPMNGTTLAALLHLPNLDGVLGAHGEPSYGGQLDDEPSLGEHLNRRLIASTGGNDAMVLERDDRTDQYKVNTRRFVLTYQIKTLKARVTLVEAALKLIHRKDGSMMKPNPNAARPDLPSSMTIVAMAVRVALLFVKVGGQDGACTFLVGDLTKSTGIALLVYSETGGQSRAAVPILFGQQGRWVLPLDEPFRAMIDES